MVSPSLEVFKNCGAAALRDMVSGHGGGEGCLDSMILEVFSNLNDPLILKPALCSFILDLLK